MNLAICVSGKYDPVFEDRGTKKILEDYFGGKVFTGTWDTDTENEGKVDHLFAVPNMHYHPGVEHESTPPPAYNQFVKNGKAAQENWKWRTLQILIHAGMMFCVPPSYDMIIRTRFDVRIDTSLDVRNFLSQSYEENIPVGFQTPKFRPETISKLDVLKKGHNRENQYLPDHLIMHRRKSFDPFYVNEMHLTKNLLPAEYGWYQSLCVYDDDHISILGFAGVK